MECSPWASVDHKISENCLVNLIANLWALIFFLREKRNKTFELKRPSDHKWFFQLLFLLFIYLFIMKWMENQKNQNNWLFLLFIEHLRLYSRIIIQKVCVCSLREFFSFYFSGLNSDDLEQSTVPQRSNTYDIDMQVHIWYTYASTHMTYMYKYSTKQEQTFSSWKVPVLGEKVHFHTLSYTHLPSLLGNGWAASTPASSLMPNCDLDSILLSLICRIRFWQYFYLLCICKLSLFTLMPASAKICPKKQPAHYTFLNSWITTNLPAVFKGLESEFDTS